MTNLLYITNLNYSEFVHKCEAAAAPNLIYIPIGGSETLDCDTPEKASLNETHFYYWTFDDEDHMNKAKQTPTYK